MANTVCRHLKNGMFSTGNQTHPDSLPSNFITAMQARDNCIESITKVSTKIKIFTVGACCRESFKPLLMPRNSERITVHFIILTLRVVQYPNV
jgi:hypothetical protein